MIIKKLIGFIDRIIDLKKFTKFGITGLINTGVDWAVFAVLYEIIGIEARFAQVIAHAVAIVNSYIINKNWTFKNNKSYKKSEMLKFLIVQGTSLLVGYAGMSALGGYLNPYLCKVIIAFVTIIINYFGNKIFVFK